MRSNGIQHIHVYGVDNCLVRVADPVFIGVCISRKSECGAKVVRKTIPTESVGVVARRGQTFGVVEYSELSREKSEMRHSSGQLAFRAANIVNHYFTMDFLDRVEAMERKMAFHIARKKIPTVSLEDGSPVKPSEPNGMKLELFVFDVFPYTDSLTVLEVERQEEFSPLKNAPGSATDGPETSRRDLLAQQKRWLEAQGAKLADGAEVEVLPQVTYGGEGLEWASGKHFEKSEVIRDAGKVESLSA
jgi:UDP-N-acetylglucosamine/UDP-N-acetylgalactosamine diphosphorylase